MNLTSDFTLEFENGGTSHPIVWVDQVVDDNNASFWYLDQSDGTLHSTGVVSRGDGEGQFREIATKPSTGASG